MCVPAHPVELLLRVEGEVGVLGAVVPDEDVELGAVGGRLQRGPLQPPLEDRGQVPEFLSRA